MTAILESVLLEHMVNYVAYLDQGETIVKGRVVKHNQTATTKYLAIFPVTFRDLRAAPEGFFQAEDLKAYEVGEPTIPLESIVVYGTHKYRAVSVSDRDKDGGFSMYVLRKLDDTETYDE